MDPPVSKGDILELGLGVAKPVHAIGQVMYARQQSSGACIVGCHLDHELAQDELWQLVSDVP